MCLCVGPMDPAALARPDGAGAVVASPSRLPSWAARRSAEDMAEPFTCAVDPEGRLGLAPRRSERVVCAGEVAFGRESGRWTVVEVTDLSTGYCPDVASWPAVAHALDRAGLGRPGGFTRVVVLRRCFERREGHFVGCSAMPGCPSGGTPDQTSRADSMRLRAWRARARLPRERSRAR